MGAILFGICAGIGNPGLFSGNDALIAFWCFLCLPGILLSTLTIFGSLMAPALTAPSVSMELNRGTWDILRVTPQPTRLILLAKLFGALARLRIWPVLFALSLLQGLLMACSVSLAAGPAAVWGWLLGIATVLRPWLEILFAAFTGMYVSTRVRSATTALAASYTAVVLFKLFNSSGLWLAVVGLIHPDETAMVVGGSVGPTAVYTLATAAVAAGIMIEANRLEYG